jgi:hypothetical protein
MKVKADNRSLAFFSKTHNLNIKTNKDLQTHLDKVGMEDFIEEDIVATFAASFAGIEYNIKGICESEEEFYMAEDIMVRLMDMVEVKAS